MNNVILSSLLILSSILLSNLVLYGFGRKRIPGVFVFSLLMLAMIIHSVGYALELLSGTLDHMYFWIRIEYLGASFYPFLIMLFAREYADEKKFANKFVLSFLLTINIVTLILVYTNSYHGLYYASVGVDSSPGFNILALEKGIWYYVQVVAIYFSVVYSIIIFSIRLKQAKGDYRKKVAFTLAGLCIPLITLFIYMSNLGPIYVDLTPFSYLFMSLLIIFGLLRYDMLALTPITYEMVFNSIGEAVLVLDKDNILLNSNLAAKKLFPSLEQIKIGESIHLLEELKDYDFNRGQSIYERNGKILSFQVNNLISSRVSIYVVNDITESEQVKKQLEILATNDALTGLYNRRYFMEIMEEKAAKGVFAMIDLDFFKAINDTFGHLEGDQVLSNFGAEIKQFFQKQTACRYGGEEFVVFIQDTDVLEAYERLEWLRKNMELSNRKIKVTFSAGLAEYKDGNIEEALRKADEKLYEAKANGRNQIRY
jgi:diguanylate cyclase (GGDEF) domain